LDLDLCHYHVAGLIGGHPFTSYLSGFDRGVVLLFDPFLFGDNHFMCVNFKNCVCELGEESCTCVKKKIMDFG